MVPQKCDGPCQRNLMIWDTTRVWCRMEKGLGEAYLCDDCMPPGNFKREEDMEINFVRLSDAKARAQKLAEIERKTREEMRKIAGVDLRDGFDPGFHHPEIGSEDRYAKRVRQVPWLRHTFWWFVHNCVAHPIIGILPFTPFFKFHDWTSVKMHAKGR